MKKITYIIIYISQFLLPSSLYSQKSEKQDSLKVKAEKPLPFKVKLKYADALFQAGNYYDALKEYGEILNMKPDNGHAMYHMGESYHRVRDYASAERWYVKVIEAGADGNFPLVFYRLATVQKMNGKYDEAKYSFAKFALRAQGDYITRAKREIEACDFAKNAIENPASFKVAHLDSAINSPYSEYAPLTEGGKLYYSSFRKAGDEMHEANNWSHIFVSEKKSDAWQTGKLMHPPFNLSDYHTGNLAYSPDGQRAYFTRCTDKGEPNIRCDIMLSVKSGSDWLNPVPLDIPGRDEKYTYTHPSVASENGTDIVYFSSDMPGGSGGFDLWLMEVKPGGSASAPVNLGTAVNTIDDEITPFYFKNKLYFSSTGHIGLGGFDVFVSSGWKIGWSKPVNLGSPLNSSADDFYFNKGETPKLYYFVSNREGVYSLRSPTCCDDIFAAQDFGLQTYSFRARVFETSDTAKVQLTGARVEIFEYEKGGKKTALDKVLAGDFEFSYDMSEGRDYEIKVQKKGYFMQSLTLAAADNPEFDNLSKDFTLERIEKNKAYRLDKIYYDFNKSSLTEESKAALQNLYELLSENTKLVVEISSHTDDIGKDAYNLKLSQNRAQSVVDYLIYLGIESKRLIPKGYGESTPIAPNNTEAGRQENRRTEFKIIGELSRVGDKVIYD